MSQVSLDKWGWINRFLSVGLFTASSYLAVRNALYTYDAMRNGMSVPEAIGMSAFINLSESVIIGILFSPSALEMFVGKVASATGVKGKAALWGSRFILIASMSAITILDFTSTWGELEFDSYWRLFAISALYVVGNEVGWIISAIAWSMASPSSFSPSSRSKKTYAATAGVHTDPYAAYGAGAGDPSVDSYMNM